MDPENPTPEPPVVAPTTAPVTAPGVEAKTFTQEQVNAFVAQRLSEDRARRAPRAEPAPQPKPEAKPESKSETSDVAERIAALEEQNKRLAFNARVAKFDLPDAKANKLYTLYKATQPVDEAAWLNETIEEFGLKTPTPVQTTIATPVAAPVPPAAAPQAPTGPVNPVTTGGLVDIFNLSPQQIAQLGPSGVRAELDKIRAFSHQTSGLARLPRVPERK